MVGPLYFIPIRKMSDTSSYALSIHETFTAFSRSSCSLLTFQQSSKFRSGLVGDELYSFLQSLTHRRNFARFVLLYQYLGAKCSDDRHSLVPLIQTFTSRTYNAKYPGSNHRQSLSITFVRS